MKPLLVTANGTGVPDPFGPGFSTDIGRAVGANPWDGIAAQLDGRHYDSPIDWQPIGYPAAMYPMGPSVQAGRAEVNYQISRRPLGTPLFLSGYSQSAMVMAQVWAHDILDPNGMHHNRLDDVRGIIQFGDPMRCPGIANGNKVSGFPMPTKEDGYTTGGIGGPLCLTPEQTPDFYLSCALDGDLYAACPVGDDPWRQESNVGKVETGIFNIVQQATFINVVSVAEDLFVPIATVEAIINGIEFAAAGMNAPHWAYSPFVPHMVSWLLERAQAVAA